MNKIYKTLYLKALMLVMLTGLFAFSANAQSWVYDQTFNSTYLGERDTVVLDTSATFFETNVRYYLYRDIDNSFNYTDGDEILDSSTSIGDTTLTFVWDQEGLTNYRYGVAAISGLGSNADTDITDVTLTGVPGNDATAINFLEDIGGMFNFPFGSDDYYAFDNTGFRGLETGVIPELDVDNATTAIVSFDFYLVDIPEDSDDSVVFEYSLDGTTWVTLIDSLNNGYNDVGTNSAFNVSYELPAAAKEATTRFRFRQGPTSSTAQRSDYVEGEAAWYIDPESFVVSVGDEMIAYQSQIGIYSINRPFTSLAVTDTTGGQSYFGGGGFEIDAFFTGFMDQVEDFSYVAVFRNTTTGQSFSIENSDNTFGETENNPSEFVYDFEIDGVIPTNIDYSDDNSYDDWVVSVEAFTGASATVGNSENLIASGTVEGGANVTNFDGDQDRYFLSDELDIQTVDGASITMDLNKNLGGTFYPSGTEVVLEYTTDGSTFTALIPDGRTSEFISLNDTIDGFDPFTYDLSTVTGLISEMTQFRVRQLSNSGEDLDTWGIGQLSFGTEGSLVEDGTTIDYGTFNITINPPTIVLDPVDVPEDFIYPGDVVSLTYNITEGEYPAGTTFRAILDGGFYDYTIGTSDLIAPGDDQDHEISVTIPPIVGGNYSVKLQTNPESNSITIPVFNTEIEVLEVTSDNGITDNGVDIFYPGDNMTVAYQITGEVGTGAELFLEIWDNGDPMTNDDDQWVVLNSASGADIDGTITAAIPTDLNLDDPVDINGSVDPNDVDAPKIRLRIGNGELADMSSVQAIDLDGNNVGDFFISTNPSSNGYIFDIFDEALIVGNDPTDIDKLISSTERSATTIPFEMPFGGAVEMWLNGVSYDFDQDIEIQASNDEGANWTTLEVIDYDGTGLHFSDYLYITEELWGDVRFRVIYNVDGAAGEFENEVELYYVYVDVNQTVSSNSVEEHIGGQLRRLRVSLETDIETSFIEGETFDVEYTTEGNFPANTGFALLFTGTDSDGAPTVAVIATSTDLGAGTFNATVPEMAFEDDGTNLALNLYDRLEVIAYDASTGDFVPDETIPIIEDEQFLVLEGTNDEDGDYVFDKDGNRSALTVAFDLSTAQAAYLNFYFDSNFDEDDNLLVVPQLQYSIDAGTTFVNIDAEESDIEGGYLTGDMSYSVWVPAEALTSATHFRWVQELNLGDGEDEWNIDDIELELINGNEITTPYNRENDDFGITIAHPSLNDYFFDQVDKDDAIFNGESAQVTFDKVFETSDAFPSGTSFEFLFEDVTDPETNAPLRIATSMATGELTVDIPFYVEEGSYEVSVIATKMGDMGAYYYAGSEDDGIYFDDLDIFLRVIRTVLDYPENEPLYAGSTVTFNIETENNTTNSASLDDLFATLVAEDFDDGDLVLATQQGVGPITVDLPPYLRGDYDFSVYLSEGAALGAVDTEINTDSDDLVNIEEDADNFPGHTYDNEIETPYDEYINSSDSYRVQWDWNGDGYVTFSLYRSVNFADYVLIGNYAGTSGNDYHSGSTYLNAGSYVRYKWVLTSGQGMDVSDVRIEDTGNNQEVYFGSSLTPDNNATLDLEFDNDFGRGRITSREFEASELSNRTLMSVDITFDELAEDITADQFLVFEYSIDGGATFTEIGSFPDVNETEMTLFEETFLFAVEDDMKANNTIFRFSQEERNGIGVEIDNFSFIDAIELPFEYEEAYRDLANQVVLVNDVVPASSCLEDAITLSYEVRGRMGADNIVTVSYEEIGGETGDVDGIEFNVFEGTGTAEITMPAEIFEEYDNNKWFRFRFNYEDNTSEDLFDGDFTFDSDSEPYGEDLVEVVAPAYQDAEFELIDDVLACDPENAMVTVDHPQNYFTYEIFDTSDGTVLGTLTYDPEDGNTEVDLGAIAANVDLGMRILPASSDASTTCTTITSTHVEEVEILENYELYLYNDNLGEYEIVSTGQTLTICEDADVELSVRRLFVAGNTSSASNSQVEWFKGDVNTPLSDVTNLDEDDIFETGDYFARVTDGSCSYLTETITITVEESLDQPTTTLVSGSLTGCEGDDPAVLSAPAGFDYYQWSTPFGTVTTQTVEADQEGAYSVRVSNRPFNTPGTCESPYSVVVYVERFNLSEFGISTTSSITAGDVITEGEEISACEGQTIYFFDDTSWSSNGGTIQTMRSTDGGTNFSVYGNTTSSTVFLEESGTYMFTWINDDAFDNGCSVNSVSFNLTIFEQPDAVEITTTDATDFCEGAGTVTLTAPAGFAQYRWLRYGSPIGSNNNGFGNDSNTIEVRDDGDYAVQVSNEADGTGCFSIQSNEITLNVRALAADGVGVDPPATLCGPGTASVGITSTRDHLSYQIFDQNTDTPVGDAFIGSDDGDDIYVDIPLTEQTTFYVMVSYADGEGCPDPEPSTTFTLSLYNVELVLDGNTITAENIGGNGYTDIEWFRNGVRLRNRSGDRDITVTDNAEYSAEVEYGSGDCIITTNTVSIEGARIQTLFGSLEATTYPNPATDFVNVEMKGGDLGRYDVTISNLSGQVMLAETFDKASENEMMKVDVRNIEKGIYTLTVKRGNALQSFRIVKQ